MTVGQFINALHDAAWDAELVAFNGDTGKLEEVTGILYGGADNKVEICTDDMNR